MHCCDSLNKQLLVLISQIKVEDLCRLTLGGVVMKLCKLGKLEACSLIPEALQVRGWQRCIPPCSDQTVVHPHLLSQRRLYSCSCHSHQFTVISNVIIIDELFLIITCLTISVRKDIYKFEKKEKNANMQWMLLSVQHHVMYFSALLQHGCQRPHVLTLLHYMSLWWSDSDTNVFKLLGLLPALLVLIPTKQVQCFVIVHFRVDMHDHTVTAGLQEPVVC